MLTDELSSATLLTNILCVNSALFSLYTWDSIGTKLVSISLLEIS